MVATISWLPMETILTDADFQMTGADSRVNDQGDEVVRIVYRHTADVSNDYRLQLSPERPCLPPGDWNRVPDRLGRPG